MKKSRSGNDGELKNSPKWVEEAMFGKALEFNGENSYVEKTSANFALLQSLYGSKHIP